MPAKDHKVEISYRDGTKQVRRMTAEQARRAEDLPFTDLQVVSVTVTPPKR